MDDIPFNISVSFKDEITSEREERIVEHLKQQKLNLCDLFIDTDLVESLTLREALALLKTMLSPKLNTGTVHEHPLGVEIYFPIEPGQKITVRPRDPELENNAEWVTGSKVNALQLDVDLNQNFSLEDLIALNFATAAKFVPQKSGTKLVIDISLEGGVTIKYLQLQLRNFMNLCNQYTKRVNSEQFH